GCGIAVGHRGFRSLLEVQHEVECQARPARPVRIGWVVAVADQVAVHAGDPCKMCGAPCIAVAPEGVRERATRAVDGTEGRSRHAVTSETKGVVNNLLRALPDVSTRFCCSRGGAKSAGVTWGNGKISMVNRFRRV